MTKSGYIDNAHVQVLIDDIDFYMASDSGAAKVALARQKSAWMNLFKNIYLYPLQEQ